jgi:hypothetical protein
MCSLYTNKIIFTKHIYIWSCAARGAGGPLTALLTTCAALVQPTALPLSY